MRRIGCSRAYATSADGLDWEMAGVALAGRPGMWDARGARLTTVLPDGRAAYDGRATAEENWFEQTGLARLAGTPGKIAHDNEEPSADVRYLDVLPLPGRGRAHLLRGSASGREPRAAHGAHRLALGAPPEHDPHDDEDGPAATAAPTPSLSTTRAAASPPK